MDKETIQANNLFREYDGLVGLTMLNLYSIAKEKKIIHLYHFDRKNKEHLFILRVALMARDIYGFPIEIEGSWWDIFCINHKVKRGFKKIKRYKHVNGVEGEWLYAKGGVCVPELLNLMRTDGIQRLGEGFTFAEIYNQYYEGSCN